MISRTSIFLVTAAAAALGPPAFASDKNDGTALRDKDTSIVILTDRHGDRREGDRDAEGGRLHVYSLDEANLVECGADRRIIERSSPDGRDHSKVVLCTRGEQVSAADRSARLERLLDRIQHMDGLSDSSKARVTAALREAIEQERSTR